MPDDKLEKAKSIVARIIALTDSGAIVWDNGGGDGLVHMERLSGFWAFVGGGQRIAVEGVKLYPVGDAHGAHWRCVPSLELLEGDVIRLNNAIHRQFKARKDEFERKQKHEANLIPDWLEEAIAAKEEARDHGAENPEARSCR